MVAGVLASRNPPKSTSVDLPNLCAGREGGVAGGRGGSGHVGAGRSFMGMGVPLLRDSGTRASVSSGRHREDMCPFEEVKGESRHGR